MSTCFRVRLPAARTFGISHNAAVPGTRQRCLCSIRFAAALQAPALSRTTLLAVHKRFQSRTQNRKQLAIAARPQVHMVPGPMVDQVWTDTLVVVEGLSDQRAVSRAASAQVFVLHGASKSSTAAAAQLLKLRASKCKQVIVLLDPDVAGRQSRAVVEACLAGHCLHAFIPVCQATAVENIRRKMAGDVGVEHASPSQIRRALLEARPSCPGRKEFSRADLVEWGLVVEMGTSSSPQVGCVQHRAAVCAALGLGNCDGKQLLRQLNQYNFSRESVVEALQTVLGMPTGSLAHGIQPSRDPMVAAL